MKNISIYNAALFFGFRRMKYGFGYASLYTNDPINIHSRMALLKKEFTTEVEDQMGNQRK
ncbi:Hypothetical protein FKW44_010781 [Caligus rogercresseyi]|uniref:Uncharacterized protein n=1 Tax=Caligus rogercresseyi TaxID=217165 RepID=A0A7T8K998_CALRO|nr:Hypothetical protein FKW44_010781 [Caligus rogercresseyi]